MLCNFGRPRAALEVDFPDLGECCAGLVVVEGHVEAVWGGARGGPAHAHDDLLSGNWLPRRRGTGRNSAGDDAAALSE